jgi:hypothetical protein
MIIVEIPKESIQLKDKVVPKHVVIFKDKVVYVGTKPQCHRFVFYMEGTPDEMILERAKWIK